MSPSRAAVWLFGDQTDDCSDCFDALIERSARRPWLWQFLQDVTTVVRKEFAHFSHREKENISEFDSLTELFRMVRRGEERISHVRIVLVYITRAALVLEFADARPLDVFGQGDSSLARPPLLWICGGLLNALPMAASHDFSSLYAASVETAGLVCRLCHEGFQRAIAVEDELRAGMDWGISIAGLSTSVMTAALEAFHQEKNIPSHRQIQIAVKGSGWDTISGPPSVLQDFLSGADVTVQISPKIALNIKGLAHGVSISGSNLDYLLGSPSQTKTIRQPIPTGVRDCCVPSLAAGSGNKVSSSSQSWVQAALDRLLDTYDSQQASSDLLDKLQGVSEVDLVVVGPCGQLPYYARSLREAGKKIHEYPLHRLADQLPYPTIPKEYISATPTEFPGGPHQRIAIVGMAARAPGVQGGSAIPQHQHLQEYWNILAAGASVHGPVPPDHFSLDEYYSATHDGPCTTSVKHGCFLDGPGLFDARFFAVSPREATQLEPTQRNFLMCAYEALEMAGYTDCRGRDTTPPPSRLATFLGLCAHDYSDAVHPQGCSPHSLMCLARSFGPGRVNFHFGWEGPAYSIDSACASSASAIQLACMHLKRRECDMAVAGGANLLPTPHTFSILSRAGFLSTTGECKFLRADADGYCRGEFVGALVLKRLEDAVAGGDNILGVLAGSGRNHSGNAPSITHSDPGAQQRLFEKVLAQSNLCPEDIDYVEMHGTGTQVGDVAEATAVSNVFGSPAGHAPRGERRPTIRIGSVKPNIGHTEASAGVASVIKSLYMFRQQKIPPLAGMPAPLNPKLPDLAGLGIEIPCKLADFKPRASSVLGEPPIVRPRRIVVNTFDATGGNTCLVLEEPPPALVPATVSVSPAVDREHVFVTSAKSAKSHRENKQRLLQYLRANPGLSVSDLAYTTTARRMHHTAFRTAYLARTVQEAADKIEADVRSRSGKDVDTSPRYSKSPVVFVFTGQPSHYAGMGHRLFRDYPVFRRVVDRCAQMAANQGFPSFRDIIVDEHADLAHMTTVQTQLATVTVEAALTAFWASLGIEPDMVVGHSLGEYAAFHAAGVLSLADMLYLVGRRAQLVLESCVAGEFSMLAVAAPASQLEPLLTGARDHTTCRVSCRNMPSATVVSGKKRDIERLHDELRTSHQGIRSKVLPLFFGFHSAQMEPVLEGLVTAAKGVAYASPRVPVASTLTGQVIDAGTQGLINEIYLARQAREPVLFANAVHAIQSHFGGAGLQSRPFWLEVGATPVCGPFVQGTIGASLVASSLRPGCDDRQAVAEALAAMYQAGVDIDWPALHRPFRSQLRLLTLPSYAWDLTNYWVTQTRHGDWTPLHKPPPAKSEELGFSGYTCLGRVIDMAGPSDQAGTTAQVIFSTSIDQPAMKDLIAAHRVLGVALCPASVFTDMAGAAVSFVLKSHSGHLSRQEDDDDKQDLTQPVLVLRDMSLHRPVLLQESSPYRSITTKIVQEGDDDESRFSVVFYQQQPSNPSAQQEIGGCSVEVLAQAAPGEIKESWTNMAYFIQRRCDTLVQDPKSHRLNPSVFYALFSARVEYMEAFQGVQQAFVSPDFQEATAHVCLRPGPAGAIFSASPYHHDSVAHIAGFLLNARPDRPHDVVYMLNSIERSMCLEPLVAGSPYMVYARVVKVDGADCYCNVYGFKDDAMVLETVGLHFREMPVAVAETILGKNLAVKRTSPPVKPRGSLAASPSLRSQPKSSGASFGSSKKRNTSSSEYFSEPAATTNGSPLSSHGKTSAKPEVRDAGDQRLANADFEAILECIASQTGADLGQLTDDLCLADLGVESIMTFLITRAVETDLGIVLPASLLLSYDGGPSPTIRQLREQLVLPPDDLPKADTPSTSKEEESNRPATAMLTPSSSPNGKNGDKVETNTDGDPTTGSTDGAGRYGSFSSEISAGDFEIGRPDGLRREQISPPLTTVTAEPDPGVGLAAVSSPVPPHQEVISTPKDSELRSVVHLLQGRPSDDRTPLFLMADGSGSAATYVHWPLLSSMTPVYGVESACLRCPDQIPKIGGIRGLAAKAVEAILASRYQGQSSSSGFLLGGFSGGALVAYEAACQLRRAGHRVRGLLIIDMIAPRREPPRGGWASEYDDEDEYITPTEGMKLLLTLAPPVGRAFWELHMRESRAREHQAEKIRAVARYQAEPLQVDADGYGPGPAEKTAIVWAKRGVLDQEIEGDELISTIRSRMRGLLEARRAAQGADYNFMNDAELGPIAWSYMPGREFGPNGWEAFVGSEHECFVVDSDHYSMPLPPDVKRLGDVVEKALAYFHEGE